MKKPLILISNDDGIQAPGLRALCEAMLPLGKVVIMAPDVERSAMGHAITISDPLRVFTVDLGLPEVTAYACSGTPADCVKLAILAVLSRPPDLVVSGINHGSNTGVNVIYSGTVSAATEGTILGIPSFAISVDSLDQTIDLTPAGTVASDIAQRVLERGLPEGTLLNVNVPGNHAGHFTNGGRNGRDYSLTIHGKSDWIDQFHRRADPNNRTYYWLAGSKRDIEEAANTDEETVKAGKVSITPLHYDLTDHAFLEDLARWDLFESA